jgi:hypothetical protein
MEDEASFFFVSFFFTSGAGQHKLFPFHLSFSEGSSHRQAV